MDISRLRKRVFDLDAERKRLQDFLLRPKEMVYGSFYQIHRRCGNPRCRCAKGDKHQAKVLSLQEGGKTRLIYVRSKDEVWVKEQAENYRIYQKHMARIRKVNEENKPKVLHDLKDGRIDYVDLTHWDFVDRFFGFLLSTRFFEWAARSFPTPRKKEEVPVWFLLGCAIQMKLHTEVAFDNLPGILRSGAILSRVRFNVGLRDGGSTIRTRSQGQHR